LDGILSFCKQDPIHVNEKETASLFSTITPSPALEKVIEELLKKKLIKQDYRTFSIHRVVQEAVNVSFIVYFSLIDSFRNLVWSLSSISE